MYYYNGVCETGYDLFVTAIDINAEPVWTQFTDKEAVSGNFISASVLDDENNTYFTANNTGIFSVTKLGDSGEILWSRNYFEDYEGGASDILVSGNSIIVCGYITVSNSYSYKPAIISMDANGSINWEHIIDDPVVNSAMAYYIKQDHNGNIIVAADGSVNYVPVVCVYKLSPEGEELWSYNNSDVTPAYVYDLFIDNQNNITYSGILGYFGSGSAVYAEKLSANGEQIWEFSNSYGDNSLFSQAYGDNNDNIYLVGQNDNNGIIVKLGPAGEVAWEKVSADFGYYYGITGNEKNGNVFVAGGKVDSEDTYLTDLTAYNTDGTELWTNNMGDISKASYGKYVISDENNLYFSGFSIDGNANQYCLFGVYDYDGNLVYDSEYKISREVKDDFQLIDFAQNKTHISMAIQAYAFEPSIVNEYNVACFGNILKYPKNDSITTGIEVVGHPLGKMSYCPNPVREALNISSKEDIHKIDIYNTSGILIGNYELQAVKSFRLNVANLLPGVYFVNVKTEERTEVFKFIKE
jgi:hypothetical protein